MTQTSMMCAITVNVPPTDVLDTYRKLLIVQRELTLTRKRSAYPAEGFFPGTQGLDALNGQSSHNSNEFQVIWRKGVALYILDVESTRRF